MRLEYSVMCDDLDFDQREDLLDEVAASLKGDNRRTFNANEHVSHREEGNLRFSIIPSREEVVALEKVFTQLHLDYKLSIPEPVAIPDNWSW